MDYLPLEKVNDALLALKKAMERLPPGESWRLALNEARAMVWDVYRDMRQPSDEEEDSHRTD